MYGNSVIKITLVTITKFTSSDMAQFRNAIAQVTATTTYMKIGVIDETLSAKIAVSKFTYAFRSHAIGTSSRKYGE